ncbi:hypothetical protein HDU76_007369 [Blyttiomyces sp. JEL0837]|nr:hypothetical protein HDU76_007369 [Blyttiomyces sp. JEL0837]
MSKNFSSVHSFGRIPTPNIGSSSSAAAVIGNQQAMNSLIARGGADDVLEGITIHYAVHLTSVLGHYLEEVRIVGFQNDDRGRLRLFSSMNTVPPYGPALNTMAMAFVAGLECFFVSVDWTVRGICISALTRLVYENEKLFMEDDHLAAIWNLHFSLGSIPLFSKVFPDRIVIIKSLGLLAPLFASIDWPLTMAVISGLLRLKDKTVQEIEAIKATVKKVIDRVFDPTNSNPALGDDKNRFDGQYSAFGRKN